MKGSFSKCNAFQRNSCLDLGQVCNISVTCMESLLSLWEPNSVCTIIVEENKGNFVSTQVASIAIYNKTMHYKFPCPRYTIYRKWVAGWGGVGWGGGVVVGQCHRKSADFPCGRELFIHDKIFLGWCWKRSSFCDLSVKAKLKPIIKTPTTGAPEEEQQGLKED